MMNMIDNETKTIVDDPTFRLTAERLVLKCGIRADLKGSVSLIDAVILFGTGLCNGFCEIYRTIGELRGLKSKSVMREISYAIKQAFNLSENLSALVGTNIPSLDIHNGLVIAYLGRLFKNPALSIYA